MPDFSVPNAYKGSRGSVSRFAAVIGCIAVLLVGTESAQACTCLPPDVRQTLARADAAFIGTLTARRPAPPPPASGPARPIGDDIFTFSVDHSVKGDLDRVVEVWSSSSGASCGLEIGLGERIGLFLTRQGDRWRSTLCWQISPAGLREAERRLPRPDGNGPVRFLVGGGFGSVRLLALDARGRTLGYGPGSATTKLLTVCPRGRRAVEVVQGQPERIAVRDVRTLSVVGETPLPAHNAAAEIYCPDPSARDVYAFVKRPPAGLLGGPSAILHIQGGRIQERYVGTADSVVFRRNAAILNDGPGGRDVVRIHLISGERRLLVRGPRRMNYLAVSPQGRTIAAVDADPRVSAPARLLVVPLDGSRPVRSKALGPPWVSAELAWLDDARLSIFLRGRTGAVLDTRLRPLGKLKNWRATDVVLTAGSAYGVVAPMSPFGQGWLQSARLPNGAARRLRGLPGSGVVIATVPGHVVLRTGRRAFCLPSERVFPGA
jgi:hypothetical protein